MLGQLATDTVLLYYHSKQTYSPVNAFPRQNGNAQTILELEGYFSQSE